MNMKNSEEVSYPTKNWLAMLLLCWFLGILGMHRLYAGKIGSGLLIAYCTVVSSLAININLYIGLACFTCVFAFIINDFVAISLKKFKDCYGRTIVDERIK